MLSALSKSDSRIIPASSAASSNAPFLCPECSEVVLLRTGAGRIPHFAHKPMSLCPFGGESDTHRRCKTAIFESLLWEPGVTRAALERPLGTARPDVSAYVSGVPVAIEVQISSLSMKTIARRTSEYANKGIYVLWLPQWTPALDSGRYSPEPWERWLHGAYFGRVYYWLHGLTVIPYHFDPHHLIVPKTSWYSKGGNKMTAGGYARKSSRYRVPVRGETLNIARDFVPKDHERWKGDGFAIPFAKLFIDRHGRFAR